MRRGDFHFDLPPELIAQHPTPERTQSRLLCLDRPSGAIRDQLFSDLPAQLCPGDLLIFNDTRVIPARLFGFKESGGKVEVLIERVLDERRALAQIRASKAPKLGTRLFLQGVTVEIQGRDDNLFELYFNDARSVREILEALGDIPLPPYITRCVQDEDRERYQTVYARTQGAVAAPTAGLHFDQILLDDLTAHGVEQAFITLHVGAGTFQPLRVDAIEEHKMHSEYFEVSERTCAQIESARQRGGRIIAVGTTSVRALESATRHGRIEPWRGETAIFIYPGYRFHSVDALITNFHLPESTLLMLVCAFAGQELTLNAYRHAVARRYRFFSYGDAMLISNELKTTSMESRA